MMAHHLETGRASPLSDFITDYVQHQNHWWLLSGDAWLRIDDPELERILGTYQRRLLRGLFSNET